MANDSLVFTKYLYVVNPISGGRDKETLLAEIEKYSQESKFHFKILLTTGDNDAENIANELKVFSPEVVVAAGGDGTVNLVAKEILNKNIILGILPMGSGNGLSKDLNIPQGNIEASLSLLKNPNISNLDTLDANGHFFMHLADIGFNAHIVKLFNSDKNRGFITYAKYAVKEFFSYKTSRYQIKTDGGNFYGKAFMVTVANTNTFGSNLTINPNGEYNDGFFEIIIIKRFPRKDAIGLFWKLIRKKINFSPYCIVLKCKEAEIHTKGPKTLQVDGEIAGRVPSVYIKINQSSLKVIVPQSKEKEPL